MPLSFESLIGLAAFGLLCLLLVIAPFLMSGFWPVTFDWQPLATFLGISACAALLLALRPLLEKNSAALPVTHHSSLVTFLPLIFLSWCALSLLTSVNRHDGVLELARVGGCVFWFFAARALVSENETRARLKTVLGAIVLGALIVCVLALLNFLNTRDIRQFSTFYNPNLFANYCAMALPLALAFWLEAWRSTPRAAAATILPALAVCIIGVGLLLTSSKGGLLSASGAMLVFLLAIWRARGNQLRVVLSTHRRVVLVTGLLLVLCGGALAYKTVLPRLQTARTTENNSTMFRVYTWRGTVDMAKARPVLGWGPGSFPVAFPRFAITGATLSAHQSWLQIAAEQGIPALLLILAVCLTSARQGWKNLRDENRDSSWPALAGALGSLTAFLLHGLTDSGWGITSITLLLFVTLAILSVECRMQNAEPHHSALGTRNSALGWLGAAVLLGLAAWSTQCAAASQELLSESRRLISQGATVAALATARDATEVDPFSPRAWTHRAQIQEALKMGGEEALRRAIELQPTRAANWLNLADWLARTNRTQEADAAYDRAVELDPNGTFTRWARGQWRLEQNNLRGWDDLEYIANLAAAPYGLYPALDENTFVNLDFARAYLKLAERAVAQGQAAKAREYFARIENDLEQARKIETTQAEIRAALGSDYQGPPPPELDELEARLRVLQARIK